MRGPPPKPTHLKIVEGNRGRRPLNESEPQPPSGAPRKPEHLSQYAATLWDRLVAELGALGILAQTDGVGMEMLCEAYDDHRTATDMIKQNALLQATGLSRMQFSEDGRYYQTIGTAGAVMWRAHPAVAQKADAERRIKAWAGEFGLTPASRTRISLGAPGEDLIAQKYFG